MRFVYLPFSVIYSLPHYFSLVIYCLPAAGATSVSFPCPVGTGSLNDGPSPSEATGVGPPWPSPSASVNTIHCN